MKATVQSRKAFLDDIEAGDVVKNASRVFLVGSIGYKTDNNKKVVGITLFDHYGSNKLPALEGKPTDVITVYVRKEPEEKKP